MTQNKAMTQAVTGNSRQPLLIRHLGRQPYQRVWDEMREFTDARSPDQTDELWLVEHDPVFTQGLAGKPEHVLNPGSIPIVQTDRGGQVTYHGPGQLVAYPLLDIDRRGLGVRCLVDRLEQAVIDLLMDRRIEGQRQDGAPGVYIDGAKVASIGLKVRRGRTYHGLSMNVCMDLTPFNFINPCGFAGLAVTQLADHIAVDQSDLPRISQAESWLCTSICQCLDYDPQITTSGNRLAPEPALP